MIASGHTDEIALFPNLAGFRTNAGNKYSST